MIDDVDPHYNPWARTRVADALPISPSPYSSFPPTAASNSAFDWPQSNLPAQPPPSRWRRYWFWLQRIAAVVFLLTAALAIWLAIAAPIAKSARPIGQPRLTLLAANGQPIAQSGALMGAPVATAKLPLHVKQALLAIEDRRFYGHIGVDPFGLARALINNVTGGGTQGGSTITQQLAKVTYLSSERSFVRKGKEMLMAFWLEIWLTKDQILERYLSNVYFGDNVYGLRAASLHYFYRQPERLTLPQAAMLAGLVQAPSRLAPTRNPVAARNRAKMVLTAMAAAGFITPVVANATEPAALDVRTQKILPTGTYFADWALPSARAVAESGYTEEAIKTTLDVRLQRIANSVIARSPIGKAQVALVAMRPNGEVVAMVGGRSYDKSPFNRATQARRQPGSTFKLIIYLAALREGMTPDSIIEDAPIETGAYRPKNSGERYRGRITLRDAFAGSSNVAAVRLYQQLGEKRVIKAARDLGIKSPLTADPSLALGTSGITLLELTSAYASIAANQLPVDPHAIATEEPNFLQSLWDGKRRYDSDTMAALRDMLSAVISQGTGRAAALRIPAFGKTGTSQDNRDALFVGFAGDLVVGVWIGNDDNAPLKGISGGGLPARIWRDFMGQAIKGAAPPARPRKKPAIVVPPETQEFDIGNSSLAVGNDGVTLKTDVGGADVDIRLGADGLSVEPANRDQ